MLAAGTRLGPYEIVGLIGEGGMGQVYRATDTRLDRTVAIKILPAVLAADPQRRERFEREARTISRLEHPHICPLYDVGDHEGQAYLVMQLLEGETLADRLARGPLSVAQTLEYGIQIAEALAAAHRAGIVHRDLKPGNVMLTRTGARLLDFGLARSAPGSSMSKTTIAGTTMTVGLTTEGTILGTLSYMAPEQLDGRDIDTRADVFAFGAVLFEMMTGLKAFDGESPARVMSAILRDEPARVSTIVPVAPAALEALIHACMAKDPQDRWQNIADVARQLRHLRDMLSGQRSQPLSGSVQASDAAALVAAQPAPRARPGPTAAWVVAGVLAVATAALLVDRQRPREDPAPPLAIHALLLPPDGTYLTDTLALSPDGRRLVFVAADANGRQQLWLRPLDAGTAQPLAGTVEASDPFWSPDGSSIAFFAGGRLKRVAAESGAVTNICDVTSAAGGTWNREGVIVFAQLDGPMMRVPAAGGRAEAVTTLEPSRGETHHLYPTFLPDGRRFTFYINSKERGLHVGALGETTRTRLFDPDPALPAGAAATPGVYADGHLLYVRDRVLLSRRFDPETLELSAEPTTLVQTVDYDPPGQAAFTVARGVLVYRSQQHRPLGDLAWVNRRGEVSATVAATPGAFRTAALSADGRTVAIDRRDAQGLPSVWLVDTTSGATTRFTAAYWASAPLWSPDGRTLAYSIAVDSPPNLAIRATAPSSSERRLTRQPSEQHFATSFTPDGRQIVFQALTPTTGADLYVIDATTDGAAPQRLLQTAANEMQGQVSPDGRWIAYVSDESGRPEVYVAPFPELQGRVAVSSGGGQRPGWRRDGRELYYLAADNTVMAAPLSVTGTTIAAGRPEPLFKTALYAGLYLPDPSGTRFLIARPAASGDPVPLHIQVNPFR